MLYSYTEWSLAFTEKYKKKIEKTMEKIFTYLMVI